MTAAAHAGLPTRSFDRLWHVGTLDPTHKRALSYEGQGLSVSRHPQDWIAIARLGGLPTWELTRAGNAFVDYHALTPAQHQAITAWGIARGYITEAPVFEVAYWDEDVEDTRAMLVATRAEAEAEAEGRYTEDDQDAVITALTLPVATAAFPDPTVRPGEIDPHQVLTVLWAEAEHPDLDGVWWEDDYRPEALSCPRVVIHSSRVDAWAARRTG